MLRSICGGRLMDQIRRILALRSTSVKLNKFINKVNREKKLVQNASKRWMKRYLLEGRKGGKDGATNPYRVFTFWRSNDLDFHGAWSQSSDFLLHTISNSWIHCWATRKNGVCVQVLTDIDIALHDAVVRCFMDTSRFHPDEGRLKKIFRSAARRRCGTGKSLQQQPF